MTPILTWVNRYIILAVAVFSAACDGGSGPDPASLRFGQVGEICVTLAVPLAVDRGELQQTLIWGGGLTCRLSMTRNNTPSRDGTTEVAKNALSDRACR